MEAGQDSIARNTVLRFRFSQPVMTSQDFAERLRVQNIQSGPEGSNSAKAIGVYLVDGEIVRHRLGRRAVERDDAGGGRPAPAEAGRRDEARQPFSVHGFLHNAHLFEHEEPRAA